MWGIPMPINTPSGLAPQYATALPSKYQKLSDDIWTNIIAACESYFISHKTTWTGDSSAPEFSDEKVLLQVESWDAYRQDSGAMGWRGNTNKEYAYDLTQLPMGIKRALCERAFVLSKEAGLWDDEEWLKKAENRRENR